MQETRLARPDMLTCRPITRSSPSNSYPAKVLPYKCRIWNGRYHTSSSHDARRQHPNCGGVCIQKSTLVDARHMSVRGMQRKVVHVSKSSSSSSSRCPESSSLPSTATNVYIQHFAIRDYNENPRKPPLQKALIQRREHPSSHPYNDC
jgi:hypothetical protein